MAVLFLGLPTVFAGMQLGASDVVAWGLGTWPIWVAVIYVRLGRARASRVDPTAFDVVRTRDSSVVASCGRLIDRAVERASSATALPRDLRAAHMILDDGVVAAAYAERRRRRAHMRACELEWAAEQIASCRAGADRDRRARWPLECLRRARGRMSEWNDGSPPWRRVLREALDLEQELTLGEDRLSDAATLGRHGGLELRVRAPGESVLAATRAELDRLEALEEVESICAPQRSTEAGGRRRARLALA